MGGSPGEQDVFKRFCSKSSGKIEKQWFILQQRNLQSIGTKKIDIACFRKVLKTTWFKPDFVPPNWVFGNDFRVD